MAARKKFEMDGIAPAVFTPMHDNGDVNLEAIDKYADILVEHSINNIFVLGTAGEGCNLSVEERKQVAERWITACKHRIENIIIHVGTCNLVETKDLAKHAESIGAPAIATLPSFFFKPSTPRNLALYLADVAKAAPSTPLMLYHIPSLTAVNFKVKEVIDEIEKIGIPNFAGVKYSSTDLCDLGQCVDHYGTKYCFSFGSDEQLCTALFLGADSGVGSTYNYASKIYHKIFDACKRGDVKTAREEQYKSQRFISYLISMGLDAGLGKAMMLPATGLDLGPPRLPMLRPSKEKMDEIKDHLRKMGFFEWIN